MASIAAMKLFMAVRNGIIKSRYDFWMHYNSLSAIDALDVDVSYVNDILFDENIDLVCLYDEDFPTLTGRVMIEDRPFLFAYRGNLKALYLPFLATAVIGTRSITPEIENRERMAIDYLVKFQEHVIVSGLAEGCDTVAHEQCMIDGGRTVAVLPTTITHIYPKSNEDLAKDIVRNGGLLITEYVTEVRDINAKKARFVERDRLEAMLAGEVVLVAGISPKLGHSGSRHAMNKAKLYKVRRIVMYDEELDKDNILFSLNREQLEDGAELFYPYSDIWVRMMKRYKRRLKEGE